MASRTDSALESTERPGSLDPPAMRVSFAPGAQDRARRSGSSDGAPAEGIAADWRARLETIQPAVHYQALGPALFEARALHSLAFNIEQTVRVAGTVCSAGFYQDEIHEAAFRIQRGIETGERIVVGVNRFVDADARAVELQRISAEETAQQMERLRELRAFRDQPAVDAALLAVEETARGTGNLLPPMREALRLRATLGEVSDALRRVFGEYRAAR